MQVEKMKDPVFPVSRPVDESAGKTGDWRTSGAPVIDMKRCSQCYICNVSCPEVAITIDPDENPKINLRTCKGCGICCEVCPKKCIVMEEE
ncbi:unnamed protein product [marine sediment metagenome]|uniref:4Fe-4S ferredoxin-type domain-containing protein n=1 Tax=marine sediment metagenome TaxID=412755 RepID=X0V7J7_9ZZZZ